MALSYSVDSLDTVPEAFRGEYTESGGKFVLNVDGAVSKTRVDEFRTNNVTLKRQMDEMNARFEGVDPEVFRELSAQATKLRDKKLVDSGKFDELMAARVEAMKADHDKTLSGLSKERDTANKQLDSLLIDGKLRDAALKAGVKPTAIADVLYRGRPVFKRVDGVATAFDGESQIYGKSGDPISFDEWVSGLAEDAPHLFDASSGSSSPKFEGGRPGGPGTVKRSVWNAMAPDDKAKAAQTMKIVD